jgi:hypothetical protein
VDHLSDRNTLRVLSFLFFHQSIVDLLNDGLHPLRSEFLLEHLLEDAQDGLELLGLITRELHADAEESTVGLFPDVVDQIFVFLVRTLSDIVDSDNFAVDFFVACEIFGVLKEVYLVVLGRVEVLQLEGRPLVGPPLPCIPLREAGCRLGRKPLGNGHELLLDFEDRSLLDEDALVEVLYEELGQDVEVLLVVSEEDLNFIIDIVNVTKFELIHLDQLHDFKDLLLEHLIDTDRLLFLVIVGYELPLKTVNQIPELFPLCSSDTTIFSPTFTLNLKFSQCFCQKAFVSCAQVIVIGGQTLLRPLHGVEGFSVITKFEVTDSHVGQAKGVGRKMLHCLLVALDGFLVLEPSFVDVSEVVKGITVARVDLDGLLVPLDGLVKIVFPFEDNGRVVVGHGVLGVLFDGIFVTLNGLGVLFHVVVGNSFRVVQLVDVLLKFINAALGLFEISY